MAFVCFLCSPCCGRSMGLLAWRIPLGGTCRVEHPGCLMSRLLLGSCRGCFLKLGPLLVVAVPAGAGAESVVDRR